MAAHEPTESTASPVPATTATSFLELGTASGRWLLLVAWLTIRNDVLVPDQS